MKLLSCKDRAALSACNRQFRQLIRFRTKALFVHSKEDIHRIMNTDWPALALIVLRDQCMPSYKWLCATSYKMQLLVGLGLSRSEKQYAALIVIAKSVQQSQGKGADYSAHCAAAFCYLQKPNCRKMDKLVLWQPVPGKDYAAMASFRSINQPSLVELNAGQEWVTTASIAALASGTWPSLRQLNLAGSKLRDDAPTSTVQWQWSGLQELALQSTHICAAGMRQLAIDPWPRLSKLYLSANELGAEAMLYLAVAWMPELQHLSLSSNRIDAAAAEHLAGASWPKLTSLGLSKNCMDDAGVEQLSKGCWPELRCLQLNGNVFTDVTSFSSVKWPLLRRLVLNKVLLSAANLHALDLSCDILQDLEEVLDIESVFVSRRKKTGTSEVHMWPHLAEVDFVP